MSDPLDRFLNSLKDKNEGYDSRLDEEDKNVDAQEQIDTFTRLCEIKTKEGEKK